MADDQASKAQKEPAPKDPLASAQGIAKRLADDGEKLLTAVDEGTQHAEDEGIEISHDVVQAGLDSIAILRNKIGLAEQALRAAAAKAKLS